ncbi:MAG: twin-arginine translocase TatA/TatE family subunit [Prevotellaceae bacterium]|nr:twin-arginine translocase TatA/TatE family subunit [Prevotellaceae bacterium]
MDILLFIGTTEIIVIALLILLLFGGKKLPELMKGLGQGVQSFKKGMKEPVDDSKETKDKEQESNVKQD